MACPNARLFYHSWCTLPLVACATEECRVRHDTQPLSDCVPQSGTPTPVAGGADSLQVRAALAGQAPLSWAVGAKVQAVYSADGNWYNAVVEGVAPSGTSLIVSYEGYAENEEVGGYSSWAHLHRLHHLHHRQGYGMGLPDSAGSGATAKTMAGVAYVEQEFQ